MKHPHRAQHLPWEDCAELPLQSETANALAWVNDMTKKLRLSPTIPTNDKKSFQS